MLRVFNHHNFSLYFRFAIYFLTTPFWKKVTKKKRKYSHKTAELQIADEKNLDKIKRCGWDLIKNYLLINIKL